MQKVIYAILVVASVSKELFCANSLGYLISYLLGILSTVSKQLFPRTYYQTKLLI